MYLSHGEVVNSHGIPFLECEHVQSLDYQTLGVTVGFEPIQPNNTSDVYFIALLVYLDAE